VGKCQDYMRCWYISQDKLTFWPATGWERNRKEITNCVHTKNVANIRFAQFASFAPGGENSRKSRSFASEHWLCLGATRAENSHRFWYERSIRIQLLGTLNDPENNPFKCLWNEKVNWIQTPCPGISEWREVIWSRSMGPCRSLLHNISRLSFSTMN